jgi:tetratricopeptide (TPR) repeat protein
MAEAIVSSEQAESVRWQAAVLLVESWLAEGHFTKAREAAQRAGNRDAVARVDGLERRYLTEVSRLQQMVETSRDPERVAEARLRIAGAHQRVGHLAMAESTYGEVIRTWPFSTAAVRAVRALAYCRWMRGDQEGALASCEAAADAVPDSPAGGEACQTMVALSLLRRGATYESCRLRLREIAERHRGTQLADTARFGIGQLYAAEDLAGPAEREWVDLATDRWDAPISERVRLSLVELRYSEGARAALAQDYSRAIAWLERAQKDVELLGAEKKAHALFTLGQAYKQMKDWARAADAFRTLAVPGCRLEEMALFELGESEQSGGRSHEALQAYTTLIARFPASALIPHCEYRISLLRQSQDPERGTASGEPWGR